jgi:putative membrane protein
MHLLTKILVTAFSLVVVARLLPGIHIDTVWAALIGACVLGIMNALVRPILVVLTLPVTILTLGVFIFILNGLLFWAASSFVPGFTIDGFLPAFVDSILVSVISYILHKIL